MRFQSGYGKSKIYYFKNTQCFKPNLNLLFSYLRDKNTLIKNMSKYINLTANIIVTITIESKVS